MENDNKTTEPVTPPATVQAATNTPTPVVEQETQEQINWKKFREAREVERKQREAAEKRAAEKEAEAAALKAAMEALVAKGNNNYQQPTNNYQTNSNDSVEISDEERIQQRIDAAFAAREEKEMKQRAQREQSELPQRLTANFADFNQVCNSDNLDYLEYHYPEVAAAFKHAPEGYDKWSNIYKAVKRFVPNTNSTKDSNKADKNFAKPQAMSIAGKTQVGDTAPQKMDDKRRQDNWSRMQRVMKGGG